jgi:TRAP-type mannitol/chloroaromatic compound transport system substrate-binding protein
VFPALQLGTIDAAEFAAPSVDLKMGLYQAAKHYYFPGWHQPATLYDIVINLDRWNALSDQHKAMLEMVCGDNVRQAIAEGESMQPDVLKELESKEAYSSLRAWTVKYDRWRKLGYLDR